MKILVISNLYPPNEIGGYEKLCFDISSKLAESNRVVVLTSDYGGKTKEYPNQKIFRDLRLLTDSKDIYQPFPGSEREVLELKDANKRAFARILKSENPDVVFIWNLFFLDNDLLEEIRNSGCKIVFFISDNWLVSFKKPNFTKIYMAGALDCHKISFNKILRKFADAIQRQGEEEIFLRESHAIFASNYMKELYRLAGMTFGNEVIIHNGVSFKNYTNKPFVNRERNVSDGKIALLYAGRLVHLKGVHIMLKAIRKLIRKYRIKNFTLTIIGDKIDKSYNEYLDSLVYSYNLKNYISWKEFVPENKLFEEFQKYDIYIFPSLYEPFSLTLIHALASGIPTVASNAGGNPEIVSNFKTGLTYDKCDANELARCLIKMIRDDRLRKTISDKAKRIAEGFSLNEMGKKIEAYLIEVANNNGHS